MCWIAVKVVSVDAGRRILLKSVLILKIAIDDPPISRCRLERLTEWRLSADFAILLVARSREIGKNIKTTWLLDPNSRGSTTSRVFLKSAPREDEEIAVSVRPLRFLVLEKQRKNHFKLRLSEVPRHSAREQKQRAENFKANIFFKLIKKSHCGILRVGSIGSLVAGIKVVAYAGDLTALVEAPSRFKIERRSQVALDLIREWGGRNRLGFSPAKSCSMTVKVRLQRPPTVRMGGDSIRAVSATTVLGMVIDDRLSFAQHALSINERAAKSFDKMSRISAASWGMRYPSLLTIYRGTFLATVKYAAGYWYTCGGLHVVRSALFRTQRPALILLTKAYRTTSTAALPVLAGVLPADLDVTLAGRVDSERDNLTRAEVWALRRRVRKEVMDDWQKRWDEETNGRELFRYFPSVPVRLSLDWVEPDYETSQLLTGHGCFRKRLYKLGLNEASECMYGLTDEDMHQVLWSCPLYNDIRAEMLGGLEVLQVGPVYYAGLVAHRRTSAGLENLRVLDTDCAADCSDEQRRRLLGSEVCFVASQVLLRES
ncbi:Retrovirus-related Pol polyprotein from type-1 retrotransposable element R1 4 [Eumeta japonica]|uniref:Retrovirus-related Pol polyprotein from type-1 retrotransposable element R1 4 n=1 Tax=Eumeta variegata TaxID=151549 RepID=A0A4C1Z6P9_EUMVA|nr:Retrovirus-related Pol polyprotein from type-1 retrotransposable element R1 4 [Eumeta japonica]